MSSDSFYVQIKNYQRIKNAKLEFVPGLNVIVGQSNNGKSAILRAIQTALFNISRESHVTLGETKSAVGIRYNDHEIIWRRDNEAASPMSYRVDGKILTKLGRGQPPIISDLMGIREVELDEMKIKLNFQKQMEYPFLLDKTPSQLFKFIVQSAEEDNVMDVIQTMKTDLNSITVNVKAYEEARESLRIATQREVARYKSKKESVETCDRVLAMESKVKRYQRLKELTESMGDLLVTIAQATEEKDKIDIRLGVLELTLSKVSESIPKVVNLSSQTEDLSRVEETVKQAQSDLSQVDGLLKQYSVLDVLSGRLTKVTELTVRRQDLDSTLEECLAYKEEYFRYKNEHAEIQGKVESIEVVLRQVSSRIDTYGELENRSSSLESIISEIESTGEVLDKQLADLKSVENQLAEVESNLNKFDICPFCGSELGGDHGGH